MIPEDRSQKAKGTGLWQLMELYTNPAKASRQRRRSFSKLRRHERGNFCSASLNLHEICWKYCPENAQAAMSR